MLCSWVVRYVVDTRPTRFWVDMRPMRLAVETWPNKFAVDTYPAVPRPMTVDWIG